MRLSSLGFVAAAIVLAGPASSHPRRIHAHALPASAMLPHDVPPSADAIELAGIAPPTGRSTVEQTYGDAAIARAQAQRRYPEEDAHDAIEAARRGTPYPCDPRVATADADVCRDDSDALGYGQGYAFTPSYVSSPAVVGDDPRVQPPVMPAITGFFWAVNSARFDSH